MSSQYKCNNDLHITVKVSVLAGDKHEVTALQVSPDQQVLAVG